MQHNFNLQGEGRWDRTLNTDNVQTLHAIGTAPTGCPSFDRLFLTSYGTLNNTTARPKTPRMSESCSTSFRARIRPGRKPLAGFCRYAFRVNHKIPVDVARACRTSGSIGTRTRFPFWNSLANAQLRI